MILDQNKKRENIKLSVMVALAAVSVVFFWPLLSHVWEIAMVNFVVYTGKPNSAAVLCALLCIYMH